MLRRDRLYFRGASRDFGNFGDLGVLRARTNTEMIRSILIGAFAALLVTSSALAQTPALPPAAPVPSTDQGTVILQATPVDPRTLQLERPSMFRGGSDYRIGRQDLLEIKVFDLEQLDQTVRVTDDGSITLPLLGRLAVAGLSKSELEALIA